MILASQSPARLKILRDAGLSPIAEPSSVDEDAVVRADQAESISQYVTKLSQAKAADVIQNHPGEDVLVLGADSSLSFDGEILGKPLTSAVALERWKRMRGRQGSLYSGQTLSDAKTGRTVTRYSFTTIWFSKISDLQLQRYVETKEPLQVAGAFTIDSLGGAFIDRIEGDYHTVVGLSLSLLREMMDELGHEYTDFWE